MPPPFLIFELYFFFPWLVNTVLLFLQMAAFCVCTCCGNMWVHQLGWFIFSKYPAIGGSISPHYRFGAPLNAVSQELSYSWRLCCSTSWDPRKSWGRKTPFSRNDKSLVSFQIILLGWILGKETSGLIVKIVVQVRLFRSVAFTFSRNREWDISNVEDAESSSMPLYPHVKIFVARCS